MAGALIFPWQRASCNCPYGRRVSLVFADVSQPYAILNVLSSRWIVAHLPSNSAQYVGNLKPLVSCYHALVNYEGHWLQHRCAFLVFISKFHSYNARLRRWPASCSQSSFSVQPFQVSARLREGSQSSSMSSGFSPVNASTGGALPWREDHMVSSTRNSSS